MDSTRQLRIARLIQKELGDIFLTYARNFHGTLITVSEVRVSSDLSIARVYLSIFPTEQAQGVTEQINSDVRSIRGLLGNRVRHQLRIVPELNFYLDDTLDQLQHIDELLHE
ncbi:MAG: 30S ribosome-binding factor RbfA [Paludibacteraceae bacterium]|nr:30S ribosome-binding factor RbfA [Paludibacteraceae bacterium]